LPPFESSGANQPGLAQNLPAAWLDVLFTYSGTGMTLTYQCAVVHTNHLRLSSFALFKSFQCISTLCSVCLVLIPAQNPIFLAYFGSVIFNLVPACFISMEYLISIST
jgi:hypothetical protein